MQIKVKIPAIKAFCHIYGNIVKKLFIIFFHIFCVQFKDIFKIYIQYKCPPFTTIMYNYRYMQDLFSRHSINLSVNYSFTLFANDFLLDLMYLNKSHVNCCLLFTS